MSSSNPSRGQAVSALAFFAGIAAVVVVVAASVITGGTATPAPTDRPSPIPSLGPTPAPTVKPNPTVQPTPAPSDGPRKVDLDNATDHDVVVVIDDRTGTLVGARSGRPGDGMSVRWFVIQAKNVDQRTIQLTWVGLPVNDEIELTISEQGGVVLVHFLQSAPPRDSDATGFDRELVLTFDHDVSADDVQATFEDRAS